MVAGGPARYGLRMPRDSSRWPLGRSILMAPTVALGLIGWSGGSAGAYGSGTPTAVSYDGSPSIGVLFASTSASRHGCTAAVVDSPAGDLVITAAHCIEGDPRQYVFVPQYHGGKEPFGAWAVSAAFAPRAWLAVRSPQADVAVLAMRPKTRDGRVEEIQDLTGGHELGSAPAPGRRVSVVAYASGVDDRPFRCTAGVYYDGGYPAFDCHSYPGGTSGAPWLLDTPSGARIAGVIGGLHQGGCNVVTSYTSAFGAQVRTTYEDAVHDDEPDTFPGQGADGC